MSENQACCSHCKVVSKRDEYPNGYCSEHWECASGCGARFVLEHTDQAGRSLRDWFAGMAMQGMLASNTPTPGMDENNVDFIIASEAYRTADAMLKERTKPIN